jgi:hypothetical protein
MHSTVIAGRWTVFDSLYEYYVGDCALYRAYLIYAGLQELYID